MGECHNSKKCLNSTRHAGFDPASRNVRLETALDSPSTAGCENKPLQPAAQGGEPVENPELVEVVEPRVMLTVRN
jgi:hypothetical protein